MKNKEIQKLRPSWFAVIFGILTVGIIALSARDNIDGDDGSIVLAKNKAEVLAYQVLQLRREAQKSEMAIQNSSGRSPASVLKEDGLVNFASEGIIGSDPWGNPYHYRVIQEQGLQKVSVWSESLGVEKNQIKVTITDADR